MARKLTYWHSGGSIHTRGTGVSDQMAEALVELYGEELEAAQAAGDSHAVAVAALLITELRIAQEDCAEYRKAQRGWVQTRFQGAAA